jgi:WD40 repeat protein
MDSFMGLETRTSEKLLDEARSAQPERDPQAHGARADIRLGSVVYGVAFSPDGTRPAAGCRDNTVRLIDVARRQEVVALRGHSDYVHAVAWSPDGTRLASGSGDSTVRIWDRLSHRERAAAERVPTGKQPHIRLKLLPTFAIRRSLRKRESRETFSCPLWITSVAHA